METWVGPAVTATVISSLIAIIGWFVAYGSARRMERIRRREKIRDFQVALLAEIRSESHHLGTLDLDAHLSTIEQNYAEAGQANTSYSPFVPRPAGPILLPTLLPEIHLLPEKTMIPSSCTFDKCN